MLGRILRDILLPRRHQTALGSDRPRVLSVGGGDRSFSLPTHYDHWEQLVLDVDPRGKPDIVCDARDLTSLKPAEFDAIYCSHNLEHYYRHDVGKVLSGFRHILKRAGFAEIRVPDLQSVIERVVANGMSLDDPLYLSPAGPISILDVIYGFGPEIEQTGQDFYSHKNGFTARTLRQTLERAGFSCIHLVDGQNPFEIRALAFNLNPTPAQRQLLGLPNLHGPTAGP